MSKITELQMIVWDPNPGDLTPTSEILNITAEKSKKLKVYILFINTFVYLLMVMEL